MILFFSFSLLKPIIEILVNGIIGCKLMIIKFWTCCSVVLLPNRFDLDANVTKYFDIWQDWGISLDSCKPVFLLEILFDINNIKVMPKMLHFVVRFRWRLPWIIFNHNHHCPNCASNKEYDVKKRSWCRSRNMSRPMSSGGNRATKNY